MEIVLICLWFKHCGNWKNIYYDIENKIMLTKKEVEFGKSFFQRSGLNYLSILDSKYLENFKKLDEPPFLIWFYGDSNLFAFYEQCIFGLDKKFLLNRSNLEAIYLIENIEQLKLSANINKCLFIVPFELLLSQKKNLNNSNLYISELELNDFEAWSRSVAKLAFALSKRALFITSSSHKKFIGKLSLHFDEGNISVFN